MKKYVVVCFLSLQPAMIIGMDTGATSKDDQGKKRESVSRVIVLNRSQPIPISNSGEFVINKQPIEPQQSKSQSFESPMATFSSSGSFMEQSCSPSFSDYRKYS